MSAPYSGRPPHELSTSGANPGQAPAGPSEAEKIPERRAWPRRRRVLPVVVEPGELRSVTEDVSGRGLFVRSRKPRKPGTVVFLRVLLPRGEISLKGVVRWVRESGVAGPTGMGIELRRECPELAG